MSLRTRVARFSEQHFVQFIGAILALLGVAVTASATLMGQCVARPIPSCPGCTYWSPEQSRCVPIACAGDANVPGGPRCQELDTTCTCVLRPCPPGQERSGDGCDCQERCRNEWQDCREYAVCVGTTPPRDCEARIAQSVAKHCWEEPTIDCAAPRPRPDAGTSSLQPVIDAGTDIADAVAARTCPACTYWAADKQACVPIACPNRCEQPTGDSCQCAPPAACADGQELRDDCRCHDRCDGYLRSCVDLARCREASGDDGRACAAKQNASRAKRCWTDRQDC